MRVLRSQERLKVKQQYDQGAALRFKKEAVFHQGLDLNVLLKMERIFLIKIGFGTRIYTSQEIILNVLSGLGVEENIFKASEDVRSLLEYARTGKEVYKSHNILEITLASIYIYLRHNQEKVGALKHHLEGRHVSWSAIVQCADSIESADEDQSFGEDSNQNESTLQFASTDAGRISTPTQRTTDELCFSFRSDLDLTEENIEFVLADTPRENSSKKRRRLKTHSVVPINHNQTVELKRNKSIV